MENKLLEIVYKYHPTERHNREHWMYFSATGKSLEQCKEQAERYYNKQIAGLGWKKITTLVSIGPIRKVSDAPFRKQTKPIDLSSTSEPSSGTTRRNSDRRKTRTSKKRRKSSG